MPSTSAPHSADTVALTIRIPRTVYDALVIWRDEADGSVEEFAASLVAQAVSFGRPDALHQDRAAMMRELHLLRAQVKVLELQMQAEAELVPIEA